MEEQVGQGQGQGQGGHLFLLLFLYNTVFFPKLSTTLLTVIISVQRILPPPLHKLVYGQLQAIFNLLYLFFAHKAL